MNAEGKRVLFVLADFGGSFFDVVFGMSRDLRARGVASAFAITSPYYGEYKGVDLGLLGEVAALSDFLTQPVQTATETERDFDRWSLYPSFERRVYYTGPYRPDLAACSRAVAFMEGVFDRLGPFDAVVSENVSCFFVDVAFREAERRGVPVLGFCAGRVPGAFNVCLDRLGIVMLENPMPFAKGIERPPEYMANWTSNLMEFSLLRASGSLLRNLLRSFQVRDVPSLEIGSLRKLQRNAYVNFLKRRVRHFRSAWWHGVFEPDVRFHDTSLDVLFPLQYRPEASTSVLARHYGDDKEIIRNIAFSLPSRARLFVKEHRSALGIREPRFYREILRYPSVHVVDANYPLKENLHRFDAVVTLTSTAGFEALQAGVPVIVLGRPFFADYPGALAVGSFAELETALRSLKKREGRPVPRPEVLERYLRVCFPGSFNVVDPKCAEPGNIARLLVPIELRLGI